MASRPGGRPPTPSSSVIDAGADQVSVRPAHLDRPLRRTTLEPTYTDPHLEELVRVAADRARHEARAEGYAAGWSQGRQAAAERAGAERAAIAQQAVLARQAVSAQVRQLLAELAGAAASARAATAPEWIEVADVLAEGALQLAAAALGRELKSIDGAVIKAVKSALRHLAEPAEAVIHLSPNDAAMLADDDSIAVQVVADPNVPDGSVIALTPAQRLRHDLPAALAAAEEVLRS
jgi:flagellar assembly protein FliH